MKQINFTDREDEDLPPEHDCPPDLFASGMTDAEAAYWAKTFTRLAEENHND